MKKIIVSGIHLDDSSKARLEKIGDVAYFDSPSSLEEVLKQAEGADILYSNGTFLLEALPKLKDIFVVYPYVELGVFNSEELNKNGVLVANSQGGNRDSIIEWVMFMAIALFRKFIPLVRATGNPPVEMQESLKGKKVLIVGKGSIGSKISVPCEAFGMEVSFYERGDNLKDKSAGVDLIINALNCNSTSKELLNKEFFMYLKQGTYYVTFARPYTYDIDGLIMAINAGIVAGAAIDCDPEKFGDTTNEFYQKCLSNPKILVTPHVAFSTKQAINNGEEIAIQNIEAFIGGNPTNVLNKF